MDFDKERPPSADESPHTRSATIGGKGAKGMIPVAVEAYLQGGGEAPDDGLPRPMVLSCKEYLVPTEVLLDRAGISRAHLYALRKAGKAPQPIKLSPGRRGAVRYVSSEVDAWVASLIASRNQPKPGSSDGEAVHA